MRIDNNYKDNFERNFFVTSIFLAFLASIFWTYIAFIYPKFNPKGKEKQKNECRCFKKHPDNSFLQTVPKHRPPYKNS